jgi:hypothetical protein
MQMRAKFPIPPVEDKDFVSFAQAQHIQKVIDRSVRRDDFVAFREGRLDKKSTGVEIVIRHGRSRSLLPSGRRRCRLRHEAAVLLRPIRATPERDTLARSGLLRDRLIGLYHAILEKLDDFA